MGDALPGGNPGLSMTGPEAPRRDGPSQWAACRFCSHPRARRQVVRRLRRPSRSRRTGIPLRRFRSPCSSRSRSRSTLRVVDLEHCVVGADREAVVAVEAVAARHAAARLEQSRGLVETADDLFERRSPPCQLEERLRRPWRVRVVPRVECSKVAGLAASSGAGVCSRSQASIERAASLPCPTPTVTVRSARTMSPPAKTPGWPVMKPASTSTTRSSITTSGTTSSKETSAPGQGQARASRPRAPRARLSVAGSRPRRAPSARARACRRRRA